MSKFVDHLKNRVADALDHVERRTVTKHIYGPKRVDLAEKEVMVTSLVKDAGYFIGPFIDHHLRMGARHILLIDNGSTDETVGIASTYPCVSIVRNTAPAFRNESKLRSEHAAQVARGGWILFADADELVELTSSLEYLTTYCSDNNYSAVVGHMLDMFSDEPFGRLRHLNYGDAIAALRLYATDTVKSVPYHDTGAVPFHDYLRDNQCADAAIRLKMGGSRSELFGEHPFLSKHSLVRNQPDVTLMSHPHCASNVRVADTTLLLRHYKLAGDWVARDARSVAGRHWRHGEDSKRLSAISARGDQFRLRVNYPQIWNGVGPLLREGFLYSSPGFQAGRNP